jgi:hypothetical protein
VGGASRRRAGTRRRRSSHRGAHDHGEEGARRGEEWGGGGEEREGEGEGEGRGAHLGVQIRRSTSPKPRAPPRGEREMGEREVVAREKSNERKRPGERGTRMGSRGHQGRADRAGLGWAAPRAKTPWHALPHIEKSMREAESETKLSNARD